MQFKERIFNPFVKTLLVADYGRGKTRAIGTLLKHDFKVGLLDFDNGIDIIASLDLTPQQLSNLYFLPLPKNNPQSILTAINASKNWIHKEEKLGPPSKWGPDWVFAVDSLTFAGDAAHVWAEAFPDRKGSGGSVDGRSLIFQGQEKLVEFIDILTGAEFETNVVVTSHVHLVEDSYGMKKVYGTALGNALSPRLGRHFNNVWSPETKVDGKAIIRTQSTMQMPLKCSAPGLIKAEEDLDLGSMFRRIQQHYKNLQERLKKLDVNNNT